LHGEVHIAGLNYGDADGVEFGIEQIGAMRRRVHPLRVQAGDAGAFGNIFGDGAEASAFVAGAIL